MSKTWDNSSFFDLQNLFNVEGQMMVTIYTNRKSVYGRISRGSYQSDTRLLLLYVKSSQIERQLKNLEIIRTRKLNTQYEPTETRIYRQDSDIRTREQEDGAEFQYQYQYIIQNKFF